MTSFKTSSPGRPLSLSEPSTCIPNLTDRIFRQGDGQCCEASGFCDVFRCLYTSNDGIKEVAVKAFRFSFFIDDMEHKPDAEKATRRIRRELESWRRLSHRNIVPFLGIAYGFGRQGSVSLVSIWMPHGTLHTFLQAHDDQLAVAHRLQLLLDIANGLHYLHSFQITHGNLSSTNVLLDNNYTACLADFGCASLIGELPEGLNYLKTSTVGQGIRRWAAPERFAFDERESTRTIKSDIYSFGSMALFILSGRLPWSEVPTDEAIVVCVFRGLNPGRPHQRPIDDRHWALIERCWLTAPERPPAEDVISILRRFFGAYTPPPPLHDFLVPTSFSVPNHPGNDDLDDDVARSRTESQESSTSSFMPPPPEMARLPSPHEINAAKRSMSSDLLSPAISGNEPVDLSTFDMAPVKMPVNRWVAPIPIHKPGATDTESPEFVDREVKALLNKLTMEKFDSISDQIIAWANKSVNETNNWTLIQVIRLVFEKAADEAGWSEMYARLCWKMMETISPEVQDVDIQTSEGKPIAGGQLFRKYLRDRCRENFGRGWVAKETTVKVSDDQAMKKKGDESKLYPDEHHAGQKEKFGLIKFIGDLFKLQLLTESMMHQCIKRLLPNIGNPEEEEIESLCQLLKAVGQLLDVPKAGAHMDMYFARMEELCKGPDVSPTMRSMLQNVIDLRGRKWGSTRSSRMSKASAASKTPAQLPSQSVWAKRPPPNSNSSAPSPRSQSPALSHVPSPIITSHSRRPCALGQGVPIKEGVSVPRSNVGSVREGQGSAVTFGSIDDVSSPLSSPTVTPMVKTESVKSGSSKLPARLASTSSNVTPLSATPTTSSSTTSAPTKPTPRNADIAKLFQGSPSTPSQPPPTPLTTTAPSARVLNTNTSMFVPTSRAPKAIMIKNEDGTELSLEALKKCSPRPPTVPFPPPSPVTTSRRTASVRIESEKSKRKREEQARLEQEKNDAEEQAKKEGEERKRKEEGVKRKEEAAKRKEEKRRERERLQKEEEEKERLRLEEEEQKRKEARLEEERRKAEKEKEKEEKERAEWEAEEGDVIENGEIVETQVNSDVPNKPSRAQKEALRIDTSSMPPPLEIPRRRPGPLDINAAKRDTSAPLSTLVMARNIERLQDIKYPEGIKSPREDLNKDVKDGKFRYDRDFLMQFMHLCKEKPPNLPPLDILGIEPVDQSTFSGITRGGSGRHRQSSSGITPVRQSSVGLGITSGFGVKPGAAPSPFAMGQFSTPTSKLTSEERFMISSGTCSASISSGPAALQFGRPPTARTASQGGPGGHPMPSKRVRSKRVDKRTDANNVAPLEGSGFGAPGVVPALRVAFDPVAPLEISANRWVATSTVRKPGATDTESPELVDRKVRALLNKLTMEKFDFISNQIIFWANKNVSERDGRILIQVIRLVFEKATDEATWSEMYARLCRKMMEMINPEVQDDGIPNSEGKPIAGGQLFRKYLHNRFREDYERVRVAKETTATAAAAKAPDDQAVKAANEKKGENELYSNEYYAAQKAKRQGLNLIKFIGELFKLQMLTERIMHQCVKKLLGNVENPKEDKIESLCQLLKTVGQLLDVPKARAHMDVYFTRMKELCKSLNVSPRMRFMLQDVIELRDRKWVARGAVIAPITISAVHEATTKEKAAAVAQTYQRHLSMSRGGTRRGGDRNVESGPDGWSTAGGSIARPQPKAGDLSQFGKIGKPTPMVMGPSSVFTKKDPKRDSLSRTSSSPNVFSMLSQNSELVVDTVTTAKSSRPHNRKPPVDLGQVGAPEPPPQRKKLQLLPRLKPTPAEETPPPASEEEPEASAEMSGVDAKKIDEDVREFFAVRSMEEADVHFTNLPEKHRFLLVDKLVASALESKETDAVLVADFFAQAASKGQCSPGVLEAGFTSMVEILDDIAIDAPNAFKFMAIMLKGAGFDKDEERLARLAGKSMDSDKLLQLVSS